MQGIAGLKPLQARCYNAGMQPHPTPLQRWSPAFLSMLFLFLSLGLYQQVSGGDPLLGMTPAEVCPARTSGCPYLASLTRKHHLTAEMALPNGDVLALDRVGEGRDAVCSLVVLGADGASSRVLYRGAPGAGLVGGVYADGRRFNLAGVDGIYQIDAEAGMVGWSRLPEGLVLEDLEAGLTVGRAQRADGTSHFYVYRGEELRHEFHLSEMALAARLSPDGRTMGLLMADRLRLVPLTGTALPLDVPLHHAVQPDLIVSDTGLHAMVVRQDGRGIGVASPTGMTWYDVALGWPGQPLEAGVGELDPTSGRFAVTDGQRILLGRAGVPGLTEAVAAQGPADFLHLGEWTRGRALLFTVLRQGLTARDASDGMYFLDPDGGRFRSFPLTSAHVPGLEQEAACTSR